MSNTILWTESGKKQVNEMKKMIIKKKIMLGFMIDNYAQWDRYFRYLHTSLAVMIPLISFTNKMYSGDTEQTSTTTLVLSGIVAGMIKIKDTLKFGKVVTLAQQQTVKYKGLYKRIEDEMFKRDSKRQTEEDFIYWIGREYNNIEMADPELSHNMKKKFIDLCKAKGIPYDEDIDSMTAMLRDTTADVVQELTEVVVQKVTESIADRMVTDREVDDKVKEIKDQEIKVQSVNTAQPVNTSNPAQPVQTSNTSNLANTANPAQLTTSHSAIRLRSASDEKERTEFKETMKTFNPTEDMQWAMDRLADMH